MELSAPDQRRILGHVQVDEDGAVRILSFRKDERGAVNYDTVRTYFASCMLIHTGAWPRLVIDLGGVPVLDSAALGPLVQKLRETQEANGRLVLTGLQAPALREIFSLTRFDRVFPIQPNRVEAVKLAAS